MTDEEIIKTLDAVLIVKIINVTNVLYMLIVKRRQLLKMLLTLSNGKRQKLRD
jgi:hypothetical protein